MIKLLLLLIFSGNMIKLLNYQKNSLKFHKTHFTIILFAHLVNNEAVFYNNAQLSFISSQFII